MGQGPGAKQLTYISQQVGRREVFASKAGIVIFHNNGLIFHCYLS